MKSAVRNLSLCFAFLILIASFTFAQDSTMNADHHKKLGKAMKMDNMKMTKDMKGMGMESVKVDSSIIRKGTIDLKAIDKNKDGMVYEDMMDYNVISDKPGKCPICGMTLKKVTLAKAKANLEKAGFKVK